MLRNFAAIKAEVRNAALSSEEVPERALAYFDDAAADKLRSVWDQKLRSEDPPEGDEAAFFGVVAVQAAALEIDLSEADFKALETNRAKFGAKDLGDLGVPLDSINLKGAAFLAVMKWHHQAHSGSSQAEDTAAVLSQLLGQRADGGTTATLSKKDKVHIPAAIRKFGLAGLSPLLLPSQEAVDAVKLKLIKGEKFPHFDSRQKPFYPRRGTTNWSFSLENDRTADELLGEARNTSLRAAAEDIIVRQEAQVRSAYVPQAQWFLAASKIWVALALCGVLGDAPAVSIINVMALQQELTAISSYQTAEQFFEWWFRRCSEVASQKDSLTMANFLQYDAVEFNRRCAVAEPELRQFAVLHQFQR